MQKLNDLSRSLAVLEPDVTLIAVIEMSLSSWLVAGIVPGVERQPLKKLAVDESGRAAGAGVFRLLRQLSDRCEVRRHPRRQGFAGHPTGGGRRLPDDGRANRTTLWPKAQVARR